MKTKLTCQQLDDYLLGDLPAAESAAFAAHLASCGACRASTDEQQWIDELLRSPQRSVIEPAPTYLTQELFVSAIRQQQLRWRRRLVAGGFAAAAVLMLSVSWSLQLRPRAPQRAEAPMSADSAILPAVFVGGDDLITVPIESPYPNVTVVRVFATYRSDADPDLGSEPPTTTDETFESRDFNGG